MQHSQVEGASRSRAIAHSSRTRAVSTVDETVIKKLNGGISADMMEFEKNLLSLRACTSDEERLAIFNVNARPTSNQLRLSNPTE